jgi:hypothetical protein
MQKTKFQQLLDAPKGSKEYNPTQSFALQVFWVVRSPTAAKEMIEKGFAPCGKATLRDTPTTLAYFFRISRDQRLAAKMKKEVKTIGQHPHYQSAFKSIQMGIPSKGMEMKLKTGGIDSTPLAWKPDQPIAGLEAQLDFDPVVLECTEVYLDSRSFFQHSASREWMKGIPEIMKPSRSLKPTTYCVGHPTEEIWEKTLETFLKAIRFTDDNRSQVKAIQPGVFVHTPRNVRESNQVFFLELDFVVRNEKIEAFRSHLPAIQQELDAPFMIVLPTNLEDEKEQGFCEIRLMFSFIYFPDLACPTLKTLLDCAEMEGRVIVFDSRLDTDSEMSNLNAAQHFLERSGLPPAKFSILDGNKAEKSGSVAGYPLHPLFRHLIANEKANYQV